MTAKELFLEAMRRSDAREHEGFLAMQAADTTWVVPGGMELRGIEQLRGWLEPFWQGFSTSRHDLTRVFEDGNTVFAEGVWTGTNDGALQMPQGTLPPTGRTVTFPFAIVVTGDLDRGVATSVHVYFDQLEFLGQLGQLPDEAAA
ncbi:MAG TPA: nuclear transport factor 2 family protein [Gaiellales bacterium]|jgi:limonene-1,2-epoxide hydrolase|nr:nuclear transport factor 2 family protein [Gaiellales bacterium]